MKDKRKITVDLPTEMDLQILEMQIAAIKKGEKKPTASEIISKALVDFFEKKKKG